MSDLLVILVRGAAVVTLAGIVVVVAVTPLWALAATEWERREWSRGTRLWVAFCHVVLGLWLLLVAGLIVSGPPSR